MPAGRPSLYRPEYCEQVIVEMAEGKSMTAFAGEIGVNRDTVSEWRNTHPDFDEACKIGKAKCAAWWEARARAQAVSGSGSPATVIFGLKNMAPDDWKDKVQNEHSGPGGGAININYPAGSEKL